MAVVGLCGKPGTSFVDAIPPAEIRKPVARTLALDNAPQSGSLSKIAERHRPSAPARRKVMTESYLEYHGPGSVPRDLDPFNVPPFGRLSVAGLPSVNLPELLGLMKDADCKVRRKACALMARSGENVPASSPEVPVIVAALTAATHDVDEAVRYQAVFALANFGWTLNEREPETIDPCVAPPLIAALADTSGWVRAAAVSGLRNFKRPSESLDAALLRCLDDPEIGDIAILMLSDRGKLNEVATGPLIEIVLSTSRTISARQCASRVLAGRIVRDELTKDQLTQLAWQGDPSICGVAAAKLWTAAPTLGLFPIIRNTAHDATVSKLLAESADAVGRLAEMTISPSKEIRQEATDVLEHVLQHSASITGLAQALDSTKPRVREIAATALGNFGPVAKAAVPALARHLTDQDDIVRLLSAYALEKVGPAAQEALPALQQALQSNDPAVRAAASHALAKIAPQAGRH